MTLDLHGLIIQWLLALAILPMAWFALTTKHRGIHGAICLALCYPIGKILQLQLIGPQWIRHHLDDLGFVPFMVMFLFVIPLALK